MNKSQDLAPGADKAVLFHGKAKCHFCGRRVNDVVKYGPKYELGDVIAHYYCVLLSSNLQQNGQDHEGMLGFLLKDIKNELIQSKKIKCIYCDKKGANINCKKKNCKKTFHLSCGLKNGTTHQFTGHFSSYCHIHTIPQFIPKKILIEAHKNGVDCCICFEGVNLQNKRSYIWAPCCQKTWYHKKCLQRLALSAGYFFRCATCNNSTKFIQNVLNLGVFIPQQDASWELVPNAYSELLYKYEQCDAEDCKCPDGRMMNSENSIWEVILCKTCGSQGIHIGCRNLKINNPNWECSSCQKVTQNLHSTKTQKPKEVSPVQNPIENFAQEEIFAKKRCRPREDLENFVLDKRKRSKNEVQFEDDDDDDIEIDVVTIVESPKNDNKTSATVRQSRDIIEVKRVNIRQDLEEVLASVKPGPLSFKLRMLESYSNLLESSEKPKGDTKDCKLATTDIVTLSDDDETAVKLETAKLFSAEDLNIRICDEFYDF